MKNLKAMMMILCMTVALCGCGGFSEGLEDGMNAAASQKESSQESEMVEEPEEERQEPTQEETQESKKNAETQTADSVNVLMTAPVTVSEVKNGTKTEVIGEWAQIVVDKELLKATTMEEFVEFCNEVVDESGYNWFTISCGDGTGIQFAGSMSYVATYGTLDNEGCIVDDIGTIMLESDGSYSYSENE